jgi:hypothetical protein
MRKIDIENSVQQSVLPATQPLFELTTLPIFIQ